MTLEIFYASVAIGFFMEFDEEIIIARIAIALLWPGLFGMWLARWAKKEFSQKETNEGKIKL